MSNFKLEKINKKNLQVLKNLFQLYCHDISKDINWNINENGIFEAYSLDEWINNKVNFGFFIKIKEELAGFVMIDKEFKYLEFDKNSLDFSEIFILNKFKRKGVASHVAKFIFEKYPAKWEIRPVPLSKSAYTFWENFLKTTPYKVEKLNGSKKDMLLFLIILKRIYEKNKLLNKKNFCNLQKFFVCN